MSKKGTGIGGLLCSILKNLIRTSMGEMQIYGIDKMEYIKQK